MPPSKAAVEVVEPAVRPKEPAEGGTMLSLGDLPCCLGASSSA
jgi:hypothetical protein